MDQIMCASPPHTHYWYEVDMLKVSALYNSIMKTDTDPGVFLSKINQLHDELSDLDEVIPAERLTATIIDALLAE